MKKLLYFILLGSMLSACSNDFEVAAPWKEVPVVYGILSARDTAQYVRIEKAFLDPKLSALEVAQIADSLYYPENAITVWLERPLTQARVQMHRVDGNLEGYVRKEGIFATHPNWLYKVKGGTLMPGEKYRLRIERADGKADVTAETTLPGDFLITTPAPDISRKITFLPNSNTTMAWNSDVNGQYFNVYFSVRYREEDPSGNVISRDTITWEVARNVERTASPSGGSSIYRTSVAPSGESFFQFLAANIPSTTANFRYFERCAIRVVGGGKEIKEFNVTALANSGLTGAEVYPVYSNVSEGFGIFTGKNETEADNILIQEPTINAMAIHPLTQTLRFKL